MYVDVIMYRPGLDPEEGIFLLRSIDITHNVDYSIMTGQIWTGD